MTTGRFAEGTGALNGGTARPVGLNRSLLRTGWRESIVLQFPAGLPSLHRVGLFWATPQEPLLTASERLDQLRDIRHRSLKCG